MHLIPLLVAAAALVIFGVQFYRSKWKDLTALGLAVFVAAFVLGFVIQGGWSWTVH